MWGERLSPSPHAGLDVCHHLARRRPIELRLYHTLPTLSCESSHMGTGEIRAGFRGEADLWGI
jgi:hypothetical protein